jgi:threonine dehydrogenase-like Zn-dependent dehydrogenase
MCALTKYRGQDVHKVSVGDHVIVPFHISCGECFFCKKNLWSQCDTSNPNRDMAAKGYSMFPKKKMDVSKSYSSLNQENYFI